eukprot:1753493-Rhodomonas_salina.2
MFTINSAGTAGRSQVYGRWYNWPSTNSARSLRHFFPDIASERRVKQGEKVHALQAWVALEHHTHLPPLSLALRPRIRVLLPSLRLRSLSLA